MFSSYLLIYMTPTSNMTPNSIFKYQQSSPFWPIWNTILYQTEKTGIRYKNLFEESKYKMNISVWMVYSPFLYLLFLHICIMPDPEQAINFEQYLSDILSLRKYFCGTIYEIYTDKHKGLGILHFRYIRALVWVSYTLRQRIFLRIRN